MRCNKPLRGKKTLSDRRARQVGRPESRECDKQTQSVLTLETEFRKVQLMDWPSEVGNKEALQTCPVPERHGLIDSEKVSHHMPRGI